MSSINYFPRFIRPTDPPKICPNGRTNATPDRAFWWFIKWFSFVSVFPTLLVSINLFSTLCFDVICKVQYCLLIMSNVYLLIEQNKQTKMKHDDSLIRNAFIFDFCNHNYEQSLATLTQLDIRLLLKSSNYQFGK